MTKEETEVVATALAGGLLAREMNKERVYYLYRKDGKKLKLNLLPLILCK
ncbi:hypothetical protein LINPERHAP1_LOCUS5947 [Linum perenne]